MIALPEIAQDPRAQRNDEELARLGAPLASPVFTGDPKAPTPAVDDSDTSIATTAFVIGQLSSAGDGTPAMDGAAARGVSTHGARADHVHPTDTSRAPTAGPTFTGDVTLSTGNLLITQGTKGLYARQQTTNGQIVLAAAVSGEATDRLRLVPGEVHLGDGTNVPDAKIIRAAAAVLRLSGLEVTGDLGFFGTAHQAKKTVTGSRGGNAALASLLTQLAGYGLLTDSSTA